MEQILIVKTSALGDIVQSLDILSYLHSRFPNAFIDWAVEENLSPLISSHPLIRKANPLKLKLKLSNWKQFLALRKENYDYLFDLQGNIKSGLITLLARSKVKVGLGPKSVREWPNILATHIRFEVPQHLNIRLQYLSLIRQYFNDASAPIPKPMRLNTTPVEKESLDRHLSKLTAPLKIMVCPGSKWPTKQLPLETLLSLLDLIEKNLPASFLLVWGDASEKALCEKLQSNKRVLSEKLSLPLWQNLMSEMDLVIAVDSSALHLAATTQTPTFSVFGPTSPNIFKPIGNHHLAIFGKCPYGTIFEKRCPVLRSCPTAACMRDLKAEKLFEEFIKWWQRDSVPLNPCQRAEPFANPGFQRM